MNHMVSNENVNVEDPKTYFHLINGNPECTLCAYSSYSEPKNCLKKNSSYLL
jgi:hypothetical protein